MRARVPLLPLLLGCLYGQTAAPVRTVVTVEAHHAKDVPVVHREDVKVDGGTVLDWTRASGLQLFVLIDDGADTSIGSQLEDVRKFILSQPAQNEIGIAYIRNGAANVAQPLTADHSRAAHALRLPIGDFGVGASPYDAVSHLIAGWPSGAKAREILLITSGIDLYSPPGPQNPYLEHAIHDAERAGVVVHSIYYSPAGHLGHSFARINWGQSYLAQIAEGTGGESYWQGSGNPVSFAPFLQDLSKRLANQYVLTFRPGPDMKPGFQRLRLRTEIPHVELVAPEHVYVTGK